MKNTLHLFEALSSYENDLEALFGKKQFFACFPAIVYATILESSKNKNLFPNRQKTFCAKDKKVDVRQKTLLSW